MIKLFACACVAWTVCWQPAQAVAITGEGKSSCGTWATYRRTQQATAMEQWILGFAIGVGAFNPDYDPLRGLDADAVFVWVDNYCTIHPSKVVFDAAAEFVTAHPR